MNVISYEQASKTVLDSFGYATHLVHADGGSMCLDCMKDESLIEQLKEEYQLFLDEGWGEESWLLVGVDSVAEYVTEDDFIYCDHCHNVVDSVYGLVE